MNFFPKWKKIVENSDVSSLVKSERFFESIFHSGLNAQFIYSTRTFEIIEVNQKAINFFEAPMDKDLKGLYLSQLMMRYLSGDSPNLDILLSNVTDSWSGEATFITHKKNKCYGWVTTNVLPPGIHEEYQLLSIADISQIHNANEELRKATNKLNSAVHSKTRFLSSMSHELRTPLNGIIGTSNVLLSEAALPDNIKDHINVIRYSSEHMLGVVNDILDFSKIDAGKMLLKKQPFNLIHSLENIIASFSLFFKSHNVDLIADFNCDDLKEIEIEGDQTKLTQVIKNLLSNALKFTVVGKTTFRVEIKEISENDVTIYFEVKDTGIGIPAKKLDDIFHAFTQVHDDDMERKFGGTGLGLTISSELVNLMGSELKVESVLSQGSRFYFTLQFPIKKNTTELSPAIPAPLAKKDIRGVRALIVEDNEINSNILKTFLNKWQMPVKVAITGLHALELIKYHKFDIILMDLEMPQMNGYTALKKIREQNSEVPVIAFTATLLENMDSLVTESGFTDYVLKPFRPSDLKKKIELYCERKIDYA